MQTSNEVIGVILAGGLARRMKHQNKAFIELGGKPLIKHVIDRFLPQCSTVLINSNEQDERYLHYGLNVIEDSLNGFLGPLAGILAAMEWSLQHQPTNRWLASVAVDTPFLPLDLVDRLFLSTKDAQANLACAYSQGRAQPVNGLWDVRLANDLRTALTDQSLRKIDQWTARYDLAAVPFDGATIDPFFNINCQDDLIQAQQLIKSDPSNITRIV